MARNRKNVLQEELPVDKMDLFISKNYKKLIIAAGLIFGLFVFIRGLDSHRANTRAGTAENIGALEMVGLYTPEMVAQFSAIPASSKALGDYIHYTAGYQYSQLGLKDEAEVELQRVGAVYDEYAKSLRYDLGYDVAITADMLNNGVLSYVWQYRNAMNAPEGERAALITKYGETYPNSLMHDRLVKWGLK